MLRALNAGVSGLRNHQVSMDVIGNNIANVNTVGFKASRVTFEEGFSQLLQGASRPPGDSGNITGGSNPMQIGLGMNVSSVDLLFTQGNLEATGINTDLAIQGSAFFVVSDGARQYFTRSGNFQLDADGRLVSSSNGLVVQGRVAEDGVLGDIIQDIRLPFGQRSAAQATRTVLMAGNLDAEAEIGDIRQTSITVHDAMGVRDELTVTFTKVSSTQWDYEVTMADGAPVSGATGSLNFDNEGRLVAPLPTDPFVYTPAGGASDVSLTLDFGSAGGLGGLSQFASPSSAVIRSQDGYTMGNLERFSIDQTGTITGAFSNGITMVLGQVALASFNNPAGLLRTGDNMYQSSANSGSAVLGYVNEGIQSTITPGALEMSNVDLAQEFTNMIRAQRGFQSNARVITTSDEMLQELVSLKR